MILDYITNNWQTKKNILNNMINNGIVISERVFRKRIEKQNELYYTHISDKFILHSSKGYKVADTIEEIIESVNDNHKRALNLLKKESKIKKALQENENIKFDW